MLAKPHEKKRSATSRNSFVTGYLWKFFGMIEFGVFVSTTTPNSINAKNFDGGDYGRNETTEALGPEKGPAPTRKSYLRSDDFVVYAEMVAG